MNIYKYMSFEQFVSMVEKKQLYLTRIDRWEDVYEGSLIRILFKKIKEDCCHDYRKIETYNMLEQIIFQSIYAQSWSTRETESDAMWRIYSPNNAGVRIKVDSDVIRGGINTTTRNLGYIVEEFTVDYIDELPSYNMPLLDFILENITYPMRYKRIAFQHEDEYRYVACFSEEFEIARGIIHRGTELETDNRNLRFAVNRNLPTISYSICLSDIQEIILDPRAPQYHRETFEGYCENRGISSDRRRQSTLYTFG